MLWVNTRTGEGDDTLWVGGEVLGDQRNSIGSDVSPTATGLDGRPERCDKKGLFGGVKEVTLACNCQRRRSRLLTRAYKEVAFAKYMLARTPAHGN
jgi:hypothetical protein